MQADIATLKTALHGLPHADVFLPAIAPSYIAATLPNEYYRSPEEYEQALCDALHEEYQAIVDAGFILQIDDPRLVTYYMMHPDRSVADCRKLGGTTRRSDQRLDPRPPAREGALSYVLQHRCRSAHPRNGLAGHCRHPACRSTPEPIRLKQPTRDTNTNTMSSSR